MWQASPPASLRWKGSPAMPPADWGGDYRPRLNTQELLPKSEDRRQPPRTPFRPTRQASSGPCPRIPYCDEPDEPESQCSLQEEPAERRAPQTASCSTAASKRGFGQSFAPYVIPRLAIPALALRDRNHR